MPPDDGSSRLEPPGQTLKHGLERVLVAGRTPKLARWLHRNSVVILAYHNVLPDGEPPVGDTSLHLPRQRFAEQLDLLAATHDVVRLDELDRVSTGRRRPRAVITFDDAYRGALEHGLPELSRRGMPATVFAAPGLLGDRAFWWDLLASPDSGEVPTAVRERALRAHGGRQEEVLKALATAQGAAGRLPSHARSATEDELRAAAQRHDLLIGSHSWGHPNLTELDEPSIRRELHDSRGWLADRFPCVTPWLAYPYGLSSLRVAAIAKDAFAGALSLTARFVPRSLSEAARYDVPRINVPAGLSLRGFELRVSGVLRR